MCLGADVELTFPPPRQAVARRTPAPKRNTSRPARATNNVEDGVDEDSLSDTARKEGSSSRSIAKKRSKGEKGERTDAALMITLVHGDLLVVQGAVFEVSCRQWCLSPALIAWGPAVFLEENRNEYS